jgi:cephalosporin hydroxylase
MIDLGDLYDRVANDRRFNESGPSIMQRKDEILWLLDVVGRPSTCVEIGSLHGANLVMLSTMLDSRGELVSVEPEFEAPLNIDIIKDYLLEIKKDRGYNIYLEHIKLATTSDKFEDEVGYILRRPMTFVMIDALHTEEAVLTDFDIIKRLLKNGGLIAVHDIVKGGVRRAWEKIKSESDANSNEECIEYLSPETLTSYSYSGDEGWGGIGLCKIRDTWGNTCL